MAHRVNCSKLLAMEVECIKSIPVSARVNTDLLVWHLTSDGSYSVKSAYTLLTSALCTLSRSSNFEASKSLWNEIWKLSILNKNQHFL